MIKIGITGGIGCGKSYVAAIMAARGIPVYDSDSNAKRLMSSDAGLRDRLKFLAGDNVYNSDGKLNRGLLASYIFADETCRHNVESAVHPAVKNDFLRWADSIDGYDFCLFESAILFESGFQECVDFSVTVDAPLELRIQRCMERDGVERETVLQRIASQMSQDEKVRLADYVIVNDNISDLSVQIDEMIDKCKITFKRK